MALVTLSSLVSFSANHPDRSNYNNEIIFFSDVSRDLIKLIEIAPVKDFKLSPWSRFILETPLAAQLVNKFPFHGT
jgi:hypothetical protein